MKRSVMVLALILIVNIWAPMLSTDAEKSIFSYDEDNGGPISSASQSAHGIISIESDNVFQTLATQKGWSGNGTEINPYIIENLEIDANGTRFGIQVRNVDSFFTIRNCTMHNATDEHNASIGGWGIYIVNSGNVELSNNTCHSNTNGIGVDDFWRYNRTISLNNSTTCDDYQIKLTLNETGFNYSKVKTSGEDIRFIDENGDNLPYWIEDWNTNGNSTIWINITRNGTSNFTMYYGNNNAEAVSNGDATFDFFDDFEGTSIDTDVWVVTENNGEVSVQDSIARCYRDGTKNSHSHIISKESCGYKIEFGDIIESRSRSDGEVGSSHSFVYCGVVKNVDPYQSCDPGCAIRTYQGMGTLEEFILFNGGTIEQDPMSWDNLKWNIFSLSWCDQSRITACVNYGETENITSGIPSTSLYLWGHAGNQNDPFDGNPHSMYYDWYRVRKYSTIPSMISSIGTEEMRDLNIEVQNNNCSDNQDNGIVVENLPLVQEGFSGLIDVNASHGSITNNTCNNNIKGISLTDSALFRIWNNTCSGNSQSGIDLRYTFGNDIRNNTCSNNGKGISVIEDDYRYKRNITLGSQVPEEDYQIKIVLNETNFDYDHAGSDGGDIRFYNENDDELSYWIERWNDDGRSTIWIKVQSTSTSIIQMVYGNPKLDSKSSGNDVFDLFDDFSDVSLDMDIWNLSEFGSASHSIQDGYIRFSTPATIHHAIDITSKVRYDANYSMMTRARYYEWSSGMPSDIMLGWGESSTFDAITDGIYWYARGYPGGTYGGDNWAIWVQPADLDHVHTATNLSAAMNIWNKHEVRRVSRNESEFYGNDLTYHIERNKTSREDYPVLLRVKNYGAGSSTGVKLDVDWAAVRKFNGTEMGAEIGNESVYERIDAVCTSNQIIDNNTVYDNDIGILLADTTSITTSNNNINSNGIGIKVNSSEWDHVRPIYLSSPTDVNNYQMRIVLNEDNFNYSQARSDGGDIRFYDDGGSKLAYYIQKWDPTRDSHIWVNISKKGTLKIHLYYGNVYAKNESNGDATFLFFDDFNDGRYADKWTKDIQVGTVTESNGVIRLAGVYSATPNGRATLYSKRTFNGSVVMEWKSRIVSGTDIWTGMIDGQYNHVYYGITNMGNNYNIIKGGAAFGSQNLWLDSSSTNWKEMRAILNGTKYQVFRGNELEHFNRNDSLILNSNANNRTYQAWIMGHEVYSSTAEWDWMWVRTYSANELTYHFGKERHINDDIPSSSIIRENSIENCSSGLIIVNGDGFVVSNNTIYNCTEYGFHISNSKNLILRDNTISDCNISGITVVKGENMILDGNQVNESDEGISLIGGHDNTLINNIITDNTLGLSIDNLISKYDPLAEHPNEIVGYWQLETGSGNSVYDRMDHHSTGTIYGGSDWVDGIKGKALKFDGNNYAHLGSYSTKLDHFTVQAWINISSLSGNEMFFGTGHQYVPENILIWANTNGSFVFNYRNAYDNIHIFSPQYSFSQWHMVTGVFDGAGMYFYIDDNLVGHHTRDGGINVSSWYLNYHTWGASSSHRIHGVIDEPMVLNSGLTGDEISRIYHNVMNGVEYGSVNTNNVISDNLFFNNTRNGISLLYSTDNLIYNNSFRNNNGSNASYNRNNTQSFDSSGNAWNTTTGYGNYWEDWRSPDNDSDMIVDVPYNITGNKSKDHRPLVYSPLINPPLNLSVSSVFGGVNFTWEPPVEDQWDLEEGYNIYRRNGSGDFSHLDTVDPGVSYYFDNTTLYYLNYSYYLTSTNILGESRPSLSIGPFEAIIGTDSSPDNGTTGDPFTFNFTKYTGAPISQVFVEFWFDGGAHDINPMSRADLFANTTITPDSARNLSYQYNIKDTLDHWYIYPGNSIPIHDNDGPIFGVDGSSATGTTGDIYRFDIPISDNFIVVSAYVEYWFGSESRLNVTLDGVSDFSKEIDVPPDSLSTLHHIFHAVDDSGNWNSTTERSIGVIDNDLPIFIDDGSDLIATTGDSFTFRTTIEDNFDLEIVNVLFWFEVGEKRNRTMDGTGPFSYTTILLDDVTTLYYQFLAKDVNGNWNWSALRSIQISDNDRPIFGTDHTVDAYNTADPFQFFASVTDNIEIHGVCVEYWYDGDTHYNKTMTLDPAYGWKFKHMVEERVDDLHYIFHAVDDSGNWAESEESVIPITDNDQPRLIDDLTSPFATTGDTFAFRATFEDNIGISEAKVKYRYGTGNLITGEMGKSSDRYRLEIQIPSNSLTTLYYSFQVSDEEGNLKETEISSVEIFDNDRPSIIDMTTGFPETGDMFRIEAEVGDNILVSETFVEYWFGSGDRSNGSMGISTLPFMDLHIPNDSIDPLHYIIHSMDSSGNWHESIERGIDVIDDEAPMIMDNTVSITQRGENLSFLLIITDNIGLDEIMITYWFSSEENAIDHSFDQQTGFSIYIPFGDLFDLHYTIYAEDKEGNINLTTERVVILSDRIEGDAFPDDPAASLDTDGDGYPDEWNPGLSEEDSTTGLELDRFPDDPGKWGDSDSSPNIQTNLLFVLIPILLIIISAALLFVYFKKREQKNVQEQIEQLEGKIEEMRTLGMDTAEERGMLKALRGENAQGPGGYQDASRIKGGPVR